MSTLVGGHIRYSENIYVCHAVRHAAAVYLPLSHIYMVIIRDDQMFSIANLIICQCIHILYFRNIVIDGIIVSGVHIIFRNRPQCIAARYGNALIIFIDSGCGIAFRIGTKAA